jgi:hypothetical protein
VPRESQAFFDYYLESMERENIRCENPEIMLFTITELIGSTCYNCILLKQPVSMEEYLPYLHLSVQQLFQAFTRQPESLTPQTP